MNIKTECSNGLWFAWDEDTYDGAWDGNNTTGCGSTEADAIENLKEELEALDELHTNK